MAPPQRQEGGRKFESSRDGYCPTSKWPGDRHQVASCAYDPKKTTIKDARLPRILEWPKVEAKKNARAAKIEDGPKRDLICFASSE